jgi:glycosyltransferase involved in cell wall biosynthesis
VAGAESKVCYQVNWQTTLGGGEIYTRFACRALAARGWSVVLFVHRDATFWGELKLGERVAIRHMSRIEEAESELPRDALVLTHNMLDEATAARWAATRRLCGVLHMPLYDRNPAGLLGYRRLFGVSGYVLASARARGLTNLHPEPLLGVADLDARGPDAEIVQRLPYEWDERKFRDRVLALASSLSAPLRLRRHFVRHPGLTLGIVSRLTPIKQFPVLFTIIAPILAERAELRLEVFGSGGYASVRDLRRALAPLGARARFWGPQANVASVYPQLDYVLSGLPEKEALGLNLIEAQASGTPVLAVRAPPFTETVVEGASGFLYRDPRDDEGQELRALLARLSSGAARPDPRRAGAHLERFSLDAFGGRLERALEAV